MLANSFLKADALGITETEVVALIRVLGMLDRGEIGDHHFNMEFYQNECGTVGCICGWANYVSQGRAFPELTTHKDRQWDATPPLMRRMNPATRELFNISTNVDLHKARPAQAAIALRSYLTTGEPNWADALAS